MLIAVFGNCYQGECLPQVRRFIDMLSAVPGVNLMVECDFSRYLFDTGVGMAEFSDIYCDADLAICFGGDGTFLNAAARVLGRNIPLMGINTGHLGYLAGGTIGEAERLVGDIAGGNYVVERRSRLLVEVPGSDIRGCALNEVAVLKRESASMITIDTFVDDCHLARYQADGLIVATPTGSTAYNLSAGGPVVDPRGRVLVITPIAPHALTMRPLVMADDVVLRAVTTSRSDSFFLSIDGRPVPLQSGTGIVLRRAADDTLLARPAERDFIDSLRAKMLWGA